MAISSYLHGEHFDQETLRILGVAYEQVCVGLRIGDCADDVRQAIANKVIELAKTGERNPDVLCECTLKHIRQPEPEAPLRPDGATTHYRDAQNIPKSQPTDRMGAYTAEQLHMMDAAFRARVVAALRAGDESAAAATATVVTMSRRR